MAETGKKSINTRGSESQDAHTRKSMAQDGESNLTDIYKRRAVEQWGKNPCGADAAEGLEYGAREYFDAITRYRYEEYAPWMKPVIGFDRFAGKRLLEVGCGTGTDSLQFARGGAEFFGIDLSTRSVEITRCRFEVFGERGEYAQADAENLCFPGGCFDMVYSFGVLHHTPDTERAIKEVHRVLKPGGRAVIMLYNKSSLYYWIGLMLKKGILRGELFRLTRDEILSKYVEYSKSEGRPLVKVYSKKQARKLFRGFEEVHIEVHQLQRRSLGFAGRIMPQGLFNIIERKYGWNLIITAKKAK